MNYTTAALGTINQLTQEADEVQQALAAERRYWVTSTVDLELLGTRLQQQREAISGLSVQLAGSAGNFSDVAWAGFSAKARDIEAALGKLLGELHGAPTGALGGVDPASLAAGAGALLVLGIVLVLAVKW